MLEKYQKTVIQPDKMILELKPSDILYSQDSISKQFSCGILYIGDTLDQLLLDSSYIQKIQKIHVVERNGTLFSMDNRRLWVFKKAEEFGCFEKVAVIRTRKFNRNKFTTKNGGTSIRVRGDPGGNIWKIWSPVHIRDTHDHDDLNKSSSSPDFTRTSKFSRKVTDNEISESSSPVFTRTSTVSKKEMDNEISESSSPVFTRTSTVSRKVMDNEISESSSPGFTRTSTVSRKEMENEISETSSPVFTRALTFQGK